MHVRGIRVEREVVRLQGVEDRAERRAGVLAAATSGVSREGCGSSAIRTGTRCTTLVKLPVALSGGSRAYFAPVAGEIDST